MKKYWAFLLCIQLSALSFGQIIADHTVVDRYGDIPQYYIDQVKKMWLSYAGESHSGSIRSGLAALAAVNSAYAVSVVESGTPQPYTSSNLRASRATWGDVNNSSGWIYGYGEEDWFTTSTAITRTKAGIAYCNSHSLPVSAFGFGWCWDEGVSAAAYLAATRQYIDYCIASSIPTKVFFTTGPVDSYAPNDAYNKFLDYESIRNYVKQDPSRILFDFADILCFDGNGAANTRDYNGHVYPWITDSNLYPTVDAFHFSNTGALRLAKAMWWMLARIAGWDGITGSTWLGGTTNWNTASNWSSNIVPVSATNVIIPDMANDPHVTIAGAVCNNMTINVSAGLQIDAGRSLTINGNLTNNGTLTIESEGTASSGSLIVAGTSTGNITYNRDMPGSLYHYISSPVSSASLPSGRTYWLWDEPTGTWNETASCENGAGYTILTDGSKVSFTGTIVTSATRTGTAPYYSADQHYDNVRGTWGGGGWNLLGNPFTSSMDAYLFLSTNAASLDPSYHALYVFDGSGFYYIATDIPGYTGSGTFSSSSVQTGQGFYVLANYNGVPFSFTRQMQTHNTVSPMTKSAHTDVAWPGLKLKLKYEEDESSTLVVFNENMTAGLDPGYDVGRMSEGTGAEIYTTLVEKDNSVNYLRQALPVKDFDKNIIPLGVDCEQGGEVTFSAFIVPFQNFKFCLEDRVTGVVTDLGTGSYKVILPAKTYGTGRFYLKASGSITGIGTPQVEPDPMNLRIWISAGRLIIKGDVSGKAICSVYDTQGTMITESALTGETLNSVSLPSYSRGVFLVRVTDAAKVTVRKVVVL